MTTISTSEYWTTIRREPFLVGYWRVNDVAGATEAVDSAARYDLIGSYPNDQALGPTLIQNDSSAGSTVVGTSGGLTVPDTAVLEITGDISLEAWIVPYTPSQTAQIIGKLNSAATHANPFALRLNDGGLQFALGDGSAETMLTYSAPLPVSVPSLVQATCFRGAMTIYVNGLPVVTGALGSQTVSDGGQQMRVGSASSSATKVSGLLSEVAVYNGALSAQRVARHFALGQLIYPDPAHYLGVDRPALVV